jgi:hypothetical protein
VSPTSGTEFSDCEVSIEGNLPEGGNIDIDQAAAQITLDGKYSAVKINSKAADFKFKGHATNIIANSDAMRANIQFTTVEKDESIALNSKELDADIRFDQATAVSYRVDATASMIDSTLVNTLGSKPEISLKAEYARAKFR